MLLETRNGNETRNRTKLERTTRRKEAWRFIGKKHEKCKKHKTNHTSSAFSNKVLT